MNDLASAERTLQAIGARAAGNATYHAAVARVSELRKNRAEAEAHWAKAAELSPAEPAYQTQLAVVQLTSGDPGKREKALAALERLRQNPQERAAATRALLMDGASRPSDPKRLRTLANELQSYPDAPFSDRLLYLEILRQLRDPTVDEYLGTLEQAVGENPNDIASLLSWMTTNGKAAEAIGFAGRLAPETSRKLPVPIALAEAFGKMQDWDGLQRLAGDADWGGLNFMRQAHLARALRGQHEELAAEQQWTQAQKEAAVQPQRLLMLARTVAAWDWEKERLALLWEATKARDTRLEALQELYTHYAKSGDTSGLYRVLLRSTEVAPDDLTIQNNFAQVSLLLDADAERARKIAADLVRKEPSNAGYVSTYAFSLYTRGEVAEAVQAFSKLTEEQLQAPSIAAYYGIVLAAAGEKEKARGYLERGATAFLLPEERALVAKAQAAVQ
jgi:Flp pilus assembly protein TadD